MRKKKLTGILLLAVLLAVCLGILFVQNLVANSVSHHGEGYVDPATAVHIAQSGEITNVPAISQALPVTETFSP